MSVSWKRRGALMCSAAAISLVMVQQTFAQDATAETPDDGSSTRLQRIVKGAGAEKVAVDTPQAVSVIEQEDVDRKQATTVGDLLDEVPGASTVGSERPLGESFNIRGVGSGETQADEGRFILSVDGVDKNFQKYRLGGLFTDPELYKRVEVLRGPASSTLYGSGALAGVIAFSTKDAEDFLRDGEQWAVRLKGGYETNGRNYLGSKIGAWKAGDDASFLIGVNGREGFDFKDGADNTISGEHKTFSGLAKGKFYFGENRDQSLRLSYQRWRSEVEDQEFAQTQDQAAFGTIDRAVDDETVVVAYQNEALGNPWINLKAQFSYSDTLVEERNGSLTRPVFAPFGPPTFVPIFADSDYRYETLQAKAENTMEATGDDWENFLTIGAQFTQLDRTNRQVNASAPSGAQPEGVDTKVGFFAQSEWIYDERLTLIAGLRVDWRELDPAQTVKDGFANGAESVDEWAISPKIAALYKLNETWGVFGSYAHTERFATIDEVYDFRAGDVAGTNIDKEKSDNFELGFTYSQTDVFTDDAFELKTAVFHNTIRDFIFGNPLVDNSGSTTVPGEAAYANVGDVSLYGIEVEAAYDSDTWFGSLGASLIRGEDLDNGLSTSGRLNTVPPEEVFFTIGRKFLDQGVRLSWKSRFVAAQDDTLSDVSRAGVAVFPREPTDGFGVHSAHLEWVPEDGQFEGLNFRASVENIFDEEYREFLSTDPAKGRTFKFTLSKRFGG
ncbi:MAG: TonB-dependent receptor [Pseudomonadota bacterium]